MQNPALPIELPHNDGPVVVKVDQYDCCYFGIFKVM